MVYMYITEGRRAVFSNNVSNMSLYELHLNRQDANDQ
jgi:hypothetical protein